MTDQTIELAAPKYRQGTKDTNCAGCRFGEMTADGGKCKKHEMETAGPMVCDDHNPPDDDETDMAAPLLTDLAGLTPGKPFDGMACGSFTDMWGQPIVIKPEELDAYVTNTQAAIEASRTESGELVGLPIDSGNHDKGQAAGWIVAVERGDNNTLRFTPNWTDVGVQLIQGGLQRMFSPTLDLANKVVLGGSLTNWPASRKKGKVLLRPIELSQSVETGGGSPAVQNSEMEDVMTVKLTELSAEDRAELVAQVAAEMAKSTPVVEPPAELEGLTDEAKKQRKAELTAYLAQARQQAEMEFRAEMTRLQRESQIAELCARLTGGTEAAPRGYQVTAADLQAHLLKLAPDEAKWFADLLEKTQKDGFVQFAELGHSRQIAGTRELPAEVAAALNRGELKLADLANPILGLGDLDQYNLSAWKE